MRPTVFLLLVTLCFFSYSQNTSVLAPWEAEQHRQFDFWVGEWDVNLRIQQPSGEWKDQVQSTARIYRILDGKAILELWNENQINQGIKGYSLRYFNEEKNKWELWLNWPSKNRSGSTTLEGSFRHGRGEFFSQFQKNDSVTITQRYTFCDITPNSLRWDDALSEDGGKTWKEGKWIMEFTRAQQFAKDFSHDEPLLTYDNGLRCDQEEFGVFDEWLGEWQGKINNDNTANLNVYRALDGCAVLIMMEYSKDGDLVKSFSLNTYNTYAGKFEEGFLDNQPKSNFSIRYGDKTKKGIEFIKKDEVKSNWELKGDKLTWTQSIYENDKWVESIKINFTKK